VPAPATRAPLKAVELSAMALGKSSRPTISTFIDWRIGISKAFTAPIRSEIVRLLPP
jgi:hypothetical protein